MEKTIDDIYKEMLEAFHQASGYLPHSSCDLAARLYAAAAQIKGLYLQAKWTLDQCFPQTAQGVYLDQHAALRNISRGVACRAQGKLRFGISNALTGDLTVPAGTVCMTADGVRFATTADAVLSAGSLYVDVPARAVEPGKAGNVSAGAVSIMAAMPVGVKSCTNPAPFAGGEDQEDDTALRVRVLDSFRRLPNGANAAYYEQTALSCPGVAAAMAVGKPRGPGSVDLYVATSAGIPDQATLDAVDALLQERREIAVDLRVVAPAPQAVDISVAVQPAKGFSFEKAKADAGQALRGAFTGSLLGKGVTLAYMGNLLYTLESVENYRFSAPAADISSQSTVLPCLGTVEIRKMEV